MLIWRQMPTFGLRGMVSYWTTMLVVAVAVTVANVWETRHE